MVILHLMSYLKVVLVTEVFLIKEPNYPEIIMQNNSKPE